MNDAILLAIGFSIPILGGIGLILTHRARYGRLKEAIYLDLPTNYRQALEILKKLEEEKQREV